jgi:2-keto-4-pentenoate hydratase/2-oxohepta-3-ene-1,7-dioic acid hydratase in catechol pathway
MKLLSYRVDGEERYGVLADDGAGIVDARARLGERFPTLRDVIAADALDELQALRSAPPDHALDAIEFEIPIPNVAKILCAGRNYRAYHEVVEEGTAPKFPSIFGRFVSSFAAHGEDILKPAAGEHLDYEGELAVVIGRRGRNVSGADALGHVAGYTVMNEGTLRDWVGKGTQNTPAKNFYRSGAIGPWIATADEIADPMGLHITTRRNGEVVQDGDTSLMIFDVSYLIAHISKFTWLEPGDMIATGSPGGSIASSDDPRWLSAGEEIEVEISGVGTLRNAVTEE